MTDAQREAASRYKIAHKNEIIEWRKRYYHMNSEHILAKKLEKTKCLICDKLISKTNLRRHEQSKEHIKIVNDKKKEEVEVEERKTRCERIYRDQLNLHVNSTEEILNRKGITISWTDEARLTRLVYILERGHKLFRERVTPLFNKQKVSLKLYLDWQSYNRDIAERLESL